MEAYLPICGILLFALVHFLTPHYSKLFSRNAAIAGSLGGGLAAAFIFLELLPEIDHGHEMIGETIEFVILGGFLVVFALNWLSHHHFKTTHNNYRIPLATACAYNWLLVYAFPHKGNAYDIVIAGLLAIHLGFYNHSLRNENPQAFDRSGRWLLIASTVVGGLSLLAIGHPNPLLEDLLIGLLAGAIMYQIFTIDLPHVGRTNFGWFLAGVAIYGAIYLLAIYMAHKPLVE